MRYILWNMNQAILGSFFFSLLWLKPETFSIPVLVIFLSICFFLFSIYMLNDSVGIPLCRFGLNSITNDLFTYSVEHLLYLLSEYHYISWQSMYIIYLCCFHNVCLFVLYKGIFVSNFFLDSYFLYNSSNHYFCYFSNYDIILQVLQRRKYQWR